LLNLTKTLICYFPRKKKLPKNIPEIFQKYSRDIYEKVKKYISDSELDFSTSNIV